MYLSQIPICRASLRMSFRWLAVAEANREMSFCRKYTELMKVS